MLLVPNSEFLRSKWSPFRKGISTQLCNDKGGSSIAKHLSVCELYGEKNMLITRDIQRKQGILPDGAFHFCHRINI